MKPSTGRKWNALCPDPQRYEWEYNYSTEYEIIDLNWGFIRALQPDMVLETGCARGGNALRMAEALLENGQGKLIAVERNQDYIRHFEEEIKKIEEERNVRMPVSVVSADAMKWSPAENVVFDFCYFDTDNKASLVPSQFLRLKRAGHIRKGAIVAFHDTGTQWPTQKAIDEAASKGELRCLHIPCPRGATYCEVL